MGKLLALLGALSKIIPILDRLLNYFETKKGQAEGRAQAELAGRKVIDEIANDQNKRAADSLSDDDVARRLREKTG
jgi:hypothetical protein